MLQVAKRPLIVVLLVVSIMAASVTPALAGSAGGAGSEGCGSFPDPPCLPPGVCVYSGGELLIGTGNQKFNLKFTNPPAALIEKCTPGGTGSLGDEIPMDADDSLYDG